MNRVIRMTTTLQRMILVVALGSMLTACAASLEGYPDRTVDVDAELGALEEMHSTGKISEYDGETDAEAKRALRNDFVFARMTAINLHFGKFEQALFREGVGSGVATDWIVLGLGGAGALVSGGTSQILSAVSAGVIGAKGSFDKQAYFTNTITTLLGAMVANRKTVEAMIRQRLSQPVADYPLSAALSDLEAYYQAGTITGALTGIAADSGVKAGKADEILSGKFSQDTATEKLDAFVGWDGTNYTNVANKSKLDSWLRLQGLDPALDMTLFLSSEPYAGKRKEAVTFFKL